MIDQFIKNITTDQKIVHCKDCIFAEKTYLPNLGINIYNCDMIKHDLVMRDGGYCAHGITEVKYENLKKYVRRPFYNDKEQVHIYTKEEREGETND